MPSIMVKTFDAPDEKRPFASRGHLDVLRFGEGIVGRGVFEPGWKWSECVKPLAGTASCETRHEGYVMSGRMRIRMDDGEEREVGPGHVLTIEPGHDAWVVGDEPCVMLDFGGAEHYATRAAQPQPQAGTGAQQPGMH